MVTVGYRPIMWHLMKYYAHFGHKDFILVLGHKANVIKQFLDHLIQIRRYSLLLYPPPL